MSSTQLPGDPSLVSPSEVLADLISKGEGKHKYTVEDFFKTPEQANFRISPDGNYISYLGPYERRKNLFVQKIGTDTIHQLTYEKDRSLGGYTWASKDRLIYIKDTGGDENFKLFAVDKDGSNQKDLTPFDKVRIQIIDSLYDNDDEMIIGLNKNNPMLFDPYKINIHTGELTQLAVNDNPEEPFDNWLTDNTGKLRVAMKIIAGVNQRLLYRDSEDDEFTEVLTTNFKDNLTPLQFAADNSSIVYAISNINRDKSALIRYDLKNKCEVGEPLYTHDEVDVSNIIWSRKRKELIAATYTDWKGQIHYFDAQRKAMQAKWDQRFPDLDVSVISADRKEEKWILYVGSDRTYGWYYLYDSTSDTYTLLKDIMPWLDMEDMAHVKPIQYQTRDGLTLHGYLTVPAGAEAKNLPVIVNPHGGPWARDVWGYNPEIQLLANRGYAVFQVNFRSSVGYGKAFWEAGFKQWGKTMQDDITDGVHWLINQGIAHPNRIAIYGGSYGGYATLAGITFTPMLYACAIDFVGVSNLFTFMNTIPPYWKPYLDMLHEMVGHPEEDKELMTSSSPAFHVDQIQVPLFVVQGANDPRVNIDESDQIVKSLKKREVDVVYMVKYDEGHGFANEENKFEFYKAMLGFLDTYL